MRKLLATAAITAVTAFAAPASAAVYVNFLPGVQVSDVAGFTIINKFDNADGITGTGAGFIIQNGTNSNGASIPLADSIGTNYLSVLGGGTAELDLPWGTKAFAFEWGSLDTYNTLTISMLPNGTVVLVPGEDYLNASPGNGNQLNPNTNGTVVVYGDAGELFTKLHLASATNSFEIDNLAIQSVPEAGTWAMMIAGLGAVGFSLRSRKNVSVRFA